MRLLNVHSNPDELGPESRAFVVFVILKTGSVTWTKFRNHEVFRKLVFWPQYLVSHWESVSIWILEHLATVSDPETQRLAGRPTLDTRPKNASRKTFLPLLRCFSGSNHAPPGLGGARHPLPCFPPCTKRDKRCFLGALPPDESNENGMAKHSKKARPLSREW
jgi:hypothetical protein